MPNQASTASVCLTVENCVAAAPLKWSITTVAKNNEEYTLALGYFCI